MNDTNAATDEDGREGPQAGERLAAARRALKIPVGDIAKALHLDEDKVMALEANRFDVVGPPVFAKGHMRKYADLVDVAYEDVLADYYRLNREVGAPPVVGPKRRYGRELAPGPWIAAIVLVTLVFSGAWWWLQGRDSRPADRGGITREESPPPSSAETLPADDSASQSLSRDTESLDIMPPEPEVEETLPSDNGADIDDAPDVGVDPAETAPADARPDDLAAAPAAGDSIEIRLEFSGDCWTEVVDADGRRLFFDLGRSGRTVTVSGSPPVRVLLGDADNVALTVDGAAFALPPSRWADNTLRLTIDGQ